MRSQIIEGKVNLAPGSALGDRALSVAAGAGMAVHRKQQLDSSVWIENERVCKVSVNLAFFGPVACGQSHVCCPPASARGRCALYFATRQAFWGEGSDGAWLEHVNGCEKE